MYVAYVRMEGHQAPHIGPEESLESVHGQSPRHSIGAPAQVQPQSSPPRAAYPPFMQEFVQIMREVTQKPADSALDDHYKKIRK